MTSPAAESPYAAATESLRSAAKWLLTVTAGVAGLLCTGLQLSSLGRLVDTGLARFWFAIGGLVLALLGIAAIVWRASAVLADGWITLTQISDDDWTGRQHQHRRRRGNRPGAITTIFEEIDADGDELYGAVATNFGDLYARLKESNERSRRGAADADRSAELGSAARTVVEFANYRRTRDSFDRLRRSLAGGGIAAVVGIGIFAIATSPPDPPPAACAGETATPG